jgi:hypothetical protein
MTVFRRDEEQDRLYRRSMHLINALAWVLGLGATALLIYVTKGGGA